MLESNETLVKANAKVNLALRITGKRPDGYHNLSSLFQEIDLADDLIFSPAEEFSLTTNLPSLPTDERNLCTRAYFTLFKNFHPRKHYKITLIKKIPCGSGLGGGSSDAATVVKFLNSAWDLRLSTQELIKIAKTIGADVPFFILGGTQIVTGIGDILSPINLPEDFTLLLVIPALEISTAWAYAQFKPSNYKSPFDFNLLISEAKICWDKFENQFEEVIFPNFPELADIKSALYKHGAIYAGLSGSGSTMFGVFKSKELAQESARYFSNHLTIITHPIEQRRQ